MNNNILLITSNSLLKNSTLLPKLISVKITAA